MSLSEHIMFLSTQSELAQIEYRKLLRKFDLPEDDFRPLVPTHPHYDWDKEPRPEREKIREYLLTLTLEDLQKILALIYLGRGEGTWEEMMFDITRADQPYGALVGMIFDKQKLYNRYFRDAMINMSQNGLNIDAV